MPRSPGTQDPRSGPLREELKLTRGPRSLAEEVALQLRLTADSLDAHLRALFLEQGLTSAQYNVLRILRGAGTEGRRCGEISERMLSRDSDVTRLLDTLKKRGWIQRERLESDRRVVVARLTAEGRGLVDRLDGPLDGMLERLLGPLGEPALSQLSRLLEEARAHTATPPDPSSGRRKSR